MSSLDGKLDFRVLDFAQGHSGELLEASMPNLGDAR
jgi:hypothetical protein